MFIKENKIISFLSANKITRIEDFERGRLCKKYIRLCSHCFPDGVGKGKNEGTKALAEASGFSPKRLHKFREFRKAWEDLRIPVPLAFLNTIGLNRNILDYCLKHDQLEFDEVDRNTVVYPEGISARLAPFAYRYEKLPVGTTEQDAIEILRHQVQKIRVKQWIYIHPLRMILAKPVTGQNGSGAEINVISFRPSIRWEKNSMILNSDFRNVGSVRIA